MSTSPGAASLPRQAGILVLGQTAATLADIVAPLLIVRLLAKDDVGVLTSLLLVFQTTTMIAASGYPRTLLYYLPGRPIEDRRALTWQVVRVLSGLGVAAALGLLLIRDVIAPGVAMLANGIGRLFGVVAEAAEAGAAAPDQSAPWLWLVALYAGLDVPTRMLQNLLVVEERARAAAGTALLKSIGASLATLVPAALGWGVGGILGAMVAFSALYLLYTLGWVAVLYRGVGPSRARVPLRELSAFALPLGVTDMVNILNKGLDRYFIFFFFTAAAFADYQVGAWQIPVLSTVAWSVGTVYMPRYRTLLDEGRGAEAVEVWRASILRLSALVVPVTLAFMVVAEDLVRVLFTDAYLPAVPILRWYTALTLGKVAFYGALILAAGRSGDILRASAFTLLANAAVSLPLTMTVGFAGPAMGTALAFIPTVMIYCRYIARATGVPWHRTFPLLGWLRVVAVAGACALAGWVLLQAVGGPPWLRLVGTLVGICTLWLAVGSALGLVTAADRRFAADWLRLRILR
jgi:O-antigen/teichoic acid export membrane protein